MPSIAIVTITFNSSPFIENYLASLSSQTLRPDLLVIVDSGSSDTSYLHSVDNSGLANELVSKQNVGICVGNNIGWSRAKNFDYVLFLNPDAFLSDNFLEIACSYMEKPENAGVGILTGTLLGFDVQTNRPTGLIDSTGVTQRWYGRLIDRDQGAAMSILSRYSSPNRVSAVCSAVAFCRRTALESIAKDDQLWDPAFFMYKDDIDVAWRVRGAGWKLIHHPALHAYHCRGWKNRADVPKRLRVLSARNDIRLFLKHRSPYVAYALAKYCLVRILDV